MNIVKNLELLAPAKDLECGMAAITSGADAVYIGAPKFGARAAAGNSIEDIEKLARFAHRYWAKVYVTLNTILYDRELKDARDMACRLYDAGIDALIIQDMALLEMDLPPVPLFASTQTHNYSPERIKFLESVGIKRVILARELSLEQIREISSSTSMELEFFIHGALCVSFSGQCYFSHAVSGRSANRGECMQACRMKYSLEDSKGRVLIKDKYLLSLKDLNLTAHIHDLINAGITSFKIEGRLKDITYVKNITAHYNSVLRATCKVYPDSIGVRRSSSGRVYHSFTPDPDKTFNRGYTNYFVTGKPGGMASFNTQKSTGEYLGKVKSVGKESFIVDTKEVLQNGDGICFFDKDNTLQGMNVTRAEGERIFVQELKGIYIGASVYRNYGHMFVKELKRDSSRRLVNADLELVISGDKLILYAVDEDGNRAQAEMEAANTQAENQDKMIDTIRKQLMKTGESMFTVAGVRIEGQETGDKGQGRNIPFVQVSRLNELRRNVLNLLEEERLRNYRREISEIIKNSIPYPAEKLDYMGNVVNRLSRQFYERHGVKEIDPGFELQNSYDGKVLMTCKYCIKRELNVCGKVQSSRFKVQGSESGVQREMVQGLESVGKGLMSKVQEAENNIKIGEFSEPLYLTDRKRRYRLVFDCRNCQMKIVNE